MYTLSMRPVMQSMLTHRCTNFEQERASWKLSTFQERGEDTYAACGVSFSTPLTNVEMTVEELAAMIAGLDVAYKELCKELYADGDTILKDTMYMNRDNYMDCIPRSIYVAGSGALRKDPNPPFCNMPILYDAKTGNVLGWTGHSWVLKPGVPKEEMASYNSAGRCFEYEVLYTAGMDATCVHEPAALCSMISKLLLAVAPTPGDEELFVLNLSSIF